VKLFKSFKTNDINSGKQCQREFNFSIPSDIIARRSSLEDSKFDIGSVTMCLVNRPT